jgi:proteic killer suppression protein
MLISFGTKSLGKEFSDKKILVRRWGSEQVKKIMLRLTQIDAADNLSDLRKLPQVRAHELKGNRAGQISLDLKHPYRLLMQPDHDETPRKPDGGLDWEKVNAVKVLGVEDTHE